MPEATSESTPTNLPAEAGDTCHSNSVEAVSIMATLRFGWRAMGQSYHVMDRVVRC